MSYPFGHDGEMSPRVPRDNSSSRYSDDGWLRRGGGDQNRLLKYNEATWLAKAFTTRRPALLGRWPPQFHFSFFNSRASLPFASFEKLFAVPWRRRRAAAGAVAAT